MQCYKCNNIYNDYLDYCPYCGVKKEEFNVCSNCEEKLTKDILVCPVCGGKPIEETSEMKSDRLNREGLGDNITTSASDYFNEAIRFNKYNVDAWVNKAESLYYKDADKCCDAGLIINKDNMKLLFAKAKALKEDEINGKSNSKIILNNLLKRCNQKLKENKLNEDHWILKGEILIELDDKKEAIKCYSRALEINPENEKSWTRKASLYWWENDHHCEIESYKKAIELNPSNDEYYKKIGDRYHDYTHDNEKALEYYNKALELNPSDTDLWDEKGDLEIEMGKYDEALKSFTASAELTPDDDRALLSKAKIFCELNNFEEAIKCYDAALKIFSNGDTKSLKAKALIELEKYEDALKVYDEIINDYPDLDNAYFEKGHLLHKLGRYEEENDCYNRVYDR